MKKEEGQNLLAGGAYQICRRIGGGGEGEVYLVQHIPTEQLRAAKIIKSKDPGRQMHELHMMKHLHHPSLPQIIDVFQWEGQVWLIMEYIQGRTLSGIQGRAMTGEQFFQIARELAEVLIYLHSRESPVLHLDIKPSNILMKRDGHLALIDFGASVLSDSAGEAGGGFGTRGFAAPEQLENAVTGVDERADIYGFGATMYYCLYGHVPGAGAAGQDHRERRCRAGRNRGWPDGAIPSYWNRQVRAVLEKCLREEPGRRYPDSRMLYRDICRAEKKYIRRKRAGGIAAAAALFLLVVMFAAGSMLHRPPEDRTEAAGQRYSQLLEMASALGLAQAGACYEEAAQLRPDGDWGLVLLKRLTEDYLFTLEEEELLKTIIYREVSDSGQTAAEAMQQRPEIYGEFSYRLGLAYWYFYQGAGGKRAAASWFTQAVHSQEGQEQLPKWLEAARIHADIGGYYEKLGRQDEAGRRQTDFQTYWEDLKHLWMLDSLQEESAGIRRQVASELLSCLIMGTYEIRQSGESLQEIRQILEALAEVVRDEQIWPEPEQREVAAEQYQDAAAAVERVFADEGGQQFEGEQESA